MTCPDENELVRHADTHYTSLAHHLAHCAACARLVAELAPPPTPPRYRIIRPLGRVWEAEDTHLARRVALRFASTERIHEARALAQVRHPNVITVHDVGEANGALVLALELVIGLDERTWRKDRTRREIAEVWRQVAAGVEAVHRGGLVHGDIRPEHVLISEAGRVVLCGFLEPARTDDDAALRDATSDALRRPPLLARLRRAWWS